MFTKEDAELVHLQDEADAMLRNKHESIKRVGWNGPASDGSDDELIRKVFLVTYGRICVSKAEALKGA